MEDVQKCIFILCMWLFLEQNALFERRLRAARRNTDNITRKLSEMVLNISNVNSLNSTLARKKRRRRRVIQLLATHRRRPTVWAFSRASEWWDVIVPGFTHTQWVQNFRMSEETFLYLCDKLQPAMEKQNTNYRLCVPLKKRIAIALWKLATNSEYRSIGHLFGVSKTTVCRCVQDFCKAACKLLVPEQICFPDRDKLKDMAAYIENSWGLPQCVGAIDGTHIPVIGPQEDHGDYVNRKGCHSIILQGVVDGKGLFWSVDAGLPGSMHDARVLRLSTFWDAVAHGGLFPACTRNIGGVNAGYYILGDSAYPLQDWLLKPFTDNGRLTAEQMMYNERMCRARVVVENAFGRLKGRWRCLLERNDSDIELVKSMVATCCALHNLCESHGEDYQKDWDEPVVAAEPVVAPTQGAEEEGRDVRDGLMLYLNR